MIDNKMKAIELNGISFGYTDNVTNLDNITLDINENEYICVIGQNGSGKSTLSKILTGLLQPRAGTIKLFGQVVNRLNIKHLRDNIGIIFQNPDNQFIGLTPEDDIAFGLENRKVDPKQMRNIIWTVTKMVNIENLLEIEAAKLSGGQKQRVAIASVLAINPKIIIFDESTSMLDPKAKLEIKKLMLILKNKFQKTVISITHDMEEVVAADRVIILNKGKLLKMGTPKEIFEDRDFLQNVSLDVPFSLQLTKALMAININVQPNLQINDLVNEIWKLK
ncbi:MAG: energy-coupling factor transporter ATPase [Mycoplasmataceae bacterium]|nr:energy-coupling factor transporter ATPase [Mycoplasmataceae bacterium]